MKALWHLCLAITLVSFIGVFIYTAAAMCYSWSGMLSGRKPSREDLAKMPPQLRKFGRISIIISIVSLALGALFAVLSGSWDN